MGKITKSFKQFCEETGNIDLLNLWDYDLNEKSPDKVGFKSNKSIWFKCPRWLHESRAIPLFNVVKAYEEGKIYTICPKCYSIGQYIIDSYGQEYLDKIWSDKNEKSYYDIYAGSMRNKIWLRCQNDPTHPDYDLFAGNFKKSYNCPYCAGKRVCKTNSLGYLYPEVLEIWSDKNEKTPFDFTKSSEANVWWKCRDGKHDDYQRFICRSRTYNFMCPECEKENHVYPTGADASGWKGGVTPELNLIRKSKKYAEWRTTVFEKDNYVCQCCGVRGGKLQVHHILDYVTYEDKRFDVNNGITLCVNCHDSCHPGSFHNVYGTHYKTPEELEEYINDKRKQLGINIPFSIDEYWRGINILPPPKNYDNKQIKGGDKIG